MTPLGAVEESGATNDVNVRQGDRPPRLSMGGSAPEQISLHLPA
jgi:hypothetical protein